jgi:hypothetical protein
MAAGSRISREVRVANVARPRRAKAARGVRLSGDRVPVGSGWLHAAFTMADTKTRLEGGHAASLKPRSTVMPHCLSSHSGM